MIFQREDNARGKSDGTRFLGERTVTMARKKDNKLLYAGILLGIALCLQIAAYVFLRETDASVRFVWGLQILSLLASTSGLVLALLARE